MKSLPPPAIDYRVLYRAAIAQTKRNADKAVLANIEDRMMNAAAAYDDTMRTQGPHAVVQIPLTADEEALAGALYDKRIVSTKGSCRSTYEDLCVSTNSCPFCLDGEIYEIDHFLPQAHHHDLVMYPGNLVPICHPCNHIKRELLPIDANNSLLHPYFDRLPSQPWLFADLDREHGGPVLNFRVNLDPTEYGTIAPRLIYHFAKLQLDRRMRIRSAKVLVELQNDVEEHLIALGAEGLKTHFASEAARQYSLHGNILEAAAYRAASVNDAFCNGNYRN